MIAVYGLLAVFCWILSFSSLVAYKDPVESEDDGLPPLGPRTYAFMSAIFLCLGVYLMVIGINLTKDMM